MSSRRRQAQARRIWVTRARPEAEATAERLLTLGFEPVVEPVLETQTVGGAPDFEGVGALAFTSRNGVRAFAALTSERHLPVFAVGDATAEAAREAGFDDVVSASGDVEALAGLIADQRQGLEGRLLYASPEKPAADLVGALESRGVEARSQIVYRTVTAGFALPPDIFVVLVHSAKAARRLAAHPAMTHDENDMAAICISPAAAQPLQDSGFLEVMIASAPNEAAMLTELRNCDARQNRPLFPATFWMAIGFWLICIVSAVVIATLGPRLFPQEFRHVTKHAAAAPAQPLQFRGNSG